MNKSSFVDIGVLQRPKKYHQINSVGSTWPSQVPGRRAPQQPRGSQQPPDPGSGFQGKPCCGPGPPRRENTPRPRKTRVTLRRNPCLGRPFILYCPLEPQRPGVIALFLTLHQTALFSPLSFSEKLLRNGSAKGACYKVKHCVFRNQRHSSQEKEEGLAKG